MDGFDQYEIKKGYYHITIALWTINNVSSSNYVAKKSNVVQLMLFDLLIMFSSITIIFDAAMS